MIDIKYKNYNISLAYGINQEELWTIWTKDFVDVVGQYFKPIPQAKTYISLFLIFQDFQA